MYLGGYYSTTIGNIEHIENVLLHCFLINRNCLNVAGMRELVNQ